MDGRTFEENLGELLQWEKVRGLEERFELLGSDNLRDLRPAIKKARASQTENLALVRRIINETLFEQFGHERLDDARATKAYQRLLQYLGKPELLVATTNYDRAFETALENMGLEVATGFPRAPGRTPVLSPVGLIENRGDAIPVIHLHGAVGWYDTGEDVKEHPPDLPFNPTLGRPVVLYPDPNKDPIKEAFVEDLWEEFGRALDMADQILVIGHSLNDPALVRVLAERSASTSVAVTYVDSAGKQAIAKSLPNAHGFRLEFGPEFPFDRSMEELLRRA